MTESSPPPSRTPLDIAKPVFLAWEKLRLLYIALLSAWTLLLAWPMIADNPFTLIALVICGVVANLFYLLGPAIETYIRWLGCEALWVRMLLFISGTLWTALLATAFIIMNSPWIPTWL